MSAAVLQMKAQWSLSRCDVVRVKASTRIRDFWPKSGKISVENVALNKPLAEIDQTKGIDLLPRVYWNVGMHILY